MNWNRIEQIIEKKSLLNSSFYQDWSKGNLNLDDLRFYAKQYYALETTFPRLLSRVHSSCEQPHIRQILLENLNDEEQGTENHRELWLRFAEGLGLNREEVKNAEVSPTTQACINKLMGLASNPNPAVGVASLLAYEKQLPEVSESKIKGLKEFYGIDDAKTLQFFEVHKTVDAWHSEQEQKILEELNPDMDLVADAVDQTCDALLMFLDGVHKSTRLMREPEMVC